MSGRKRFRRRHIITLAAVSVLFAIFLAYQGGLFPSVQEVRANRRILEMRVLGTGAVSYDTAEVALLTAPVRKALKYEEEIRGLDRGAMSAEEYAGVCHRFRQPMIESLLSALRAYDEYPGVAERHSQSLEDKAVGRPQVLARLARCYDEEADYFASLGNIPKQQQASEAVVRWLEEFYKYDPSDDWSAWEATAAPRFIKHAAKSPEEALEYAKALSARRAKNYGLVNYLEFEARDLVLQHGRQEICIEFVEFTQSLMREWFPDEYRESANYPRLILTKARSLAMMERYAEAKALVAELEGVQMDEWSRETWERLSGREASSREQRSDASDGT
ncbi:MAG: hypothetical protein GY851_03735 [bacterium]|nr:hypothetical protein [bacterium]